MNNSFRDKTFKLSRISREDVTQDSSAVGDLISRYINRPEAFKTLI